MAFETKKERHDASNGLACLIQALVGEYLTIDLQNESSITGFVKEVDGYMNISLEKAQFEDYNGNQYFYDTLYIRGRNIRFFHIPKEISVKETIIKYLKKKFHKHSKNTTTALQRYRSKKLKQYQEETRGAIAEMKRNTQKS
ncbi:hypothetical protein PGB90_004843 [Kerria lacca]